MSFIPPSFSDDLSKPNDPCEPLKPSNLFSLKKIIHRIQLNNPFPGLAHRIRKINLRPGAANVVIRSHFDDRMEHSWQHLGQVRQPLSLLLCEVDDLFRLRRQFGDLACNAYTKQVIRVIDADLDRSKDIVARYQGDTLAVLLPYTSIDEAACLAKKIRLHVKALKEHQTTGSLIQGQPMTLSLGIATLVPTLKLRPSNLIAAAEQSLRQAQRAGGNRVILQEGCR